MGRKIVEFFKRIWFKIVKFFSSKQGKKNVKLVNSVQKHPPSHLVKNTLTIESDSVLEETQDNEKLIEEPIPETTTTTIESAQRPPEDGDIEPGNSQTDISVNSFKPYLTADPVTYNTPREQVNKFKHETGLISEQEVVKQIESAKPEPIEQKPVKIDTGGRQHKKRKKRTRVETILSKISEPVGKSSGKETKVLKSRITKPHVELNFSDISINLVIPVQIVYSQEFREKVKYTVIINGKKYSEVVSTKPQDVDMIIIEPVRFEIMEPLISWEVTYPAFFKQDTIVTYQYIHKDPDVYVFKSRRNGKSKLLEMWDANGNLNVIPKRRSWVLHSEEYKLGMEPALIEERFFWDLDFPKLVDLRDENFLLLNHKTSNKVIQIPCDTKFTLDGNRVASDDYDDDFPIYNGDVMSLISPRISKDGWAVWIQDHNEESGAIMLDERWTGEHPLIIDCPSQLPSTEGAFKLDVCPIGSRIPIEIFHFRYCQKVELVYPREIIIPNEQGHKEEQVLVNFALGANDWSMQIKESDNIIQVKSQTGFVLTVPADVDRVNFKLIKESLTLPFEVTLSRLKWKIGSESNTNSKKYWKSRIRLKHGIRLPIRVWTNQPERAYNIKAVLMQENTLLQEIPLKKIQNTVYTFDLNPFFDTIKTNFHGLTVDLVVHDSEDGKENIAHLFEFRDLHERHVLIDIFQTFDEHVGNFPDHYWKYCKDYNNGLPYATESLFKALKFATDFYSELELTGKIVRLGSSVDRVFKKQFFHNLPRFVKNVIFGMNGLYIDIKTEFDLIKFLETIHDLFDLGDKQVTVQDVFHAIAHDKNLLAILYKDYSIYRQILDVFSNELFRLDEFLEIAFLKEYNKEVKKINALRDFISIDPTKTCFGSAKIALNILRDYLFLTRRFPASGESKPVSGLYRVAFDRDTSRFLDNFLRGINPSSPLPVVTEKHAILALENLRRIKNDVEWACKIIQEHVDVRDIEADIKTFQQKRDDLNRQAKECQQQIQQLALEIKNLKQLAGENRIKRNEWNKKVKESKSKRDFYNSEKRKLKEYLKQRHDKVVPFKERNEIFKRHDQYRKQADKLHKHVIACSEKSEVHHTTLLEITDDITKKFSELHNLKRKRKAIISKADTFHQEMLELIDKKNLVKSLQSQ
ncbi:MAG: hypothetical protein ACFFCS_18410 [Candidatus Hodarchaeota archaeon]